MKKLLSFLGVLILGVLCSACVNTFAIHELNQLAAQYIEKGEIDNAISRLESSVDLDDSVYETRYNLAVAYLKKEDCNKALENIEAAKKIASDKAEVYYTLGVANSCLADKFCEDETDKTKCAQYKNDSITAYNKYIELAPDADDVNDVKELVQSISNNEENPEDD